MHDTDPVYLAYAVMYREFYEDDGVPNDHSERVIDADTDLDALRNRLNVFYADPEQIRSHRGTQLSLVPGAFKSNEWRNNGGGCFARGHVEIRKAPRIEVKLV